MRSDLPHRSPFRRVLGALFLLGIATLAVGCSGDDSEGPADDGSTGSSTEGTESEVTLPSVETDDVADRVRSLGQSGAVESPEEQDQHLAAGLAPDPDRPLFIGDYADPFVLADGEDLYLYSTNTFTEHVPVLAATTGEVAVEVGDALPELPAWTEPGWVWAPSVLRTADGYVLYYTSRHSASGRQCVGAAFSTSPTGPFTPHGDEPLVCQLEFGGTIDASPFVAASGRKWLLYKNDGNCCDIMTAIWSQELTADGLGFIGEGVPLLLRTEDWEGDLIEGPSMVEVDGRHWLLYSANDWNSEQYATGIAECESPAGPCTKRPRPWLSSHGSAAGPGGAEQFVDSAGRHWVVYHAWTSDAIGFLNGGRRVLFVVRKDYDESGPVPRGIDQG